MNEILGRRLWTMSICKYNLNMHNILNNYGTIYRINWITKFWVLFLRTSIQQKFTIRIKFYCFCYILMIIHWFTMFFLPINFQQSGGKFLIAGKCAQDLKSLLRHIHVPAFKWNAVTFLENSQYNVSTGSPNSHTLQAAHDIWYVAFQITHVHLRRYMSHGTNKS